MHMKPTTQESIMDAPFFKKLVAYRDVILLLLFFLSGAAWIYNTFATKCALEASLEVGKIATEQQNEINEVRNKRLEIRNLESLQAAVTLNEKQIEQLNKLRDEYQEMAEKKTDYTERITEAYKKCTSF